MSAEIHPFPGLRPFLDEESFLFFGRDEPIDELLRRLRRQRFLAVVGTSGSGKSSLVRAGLLPALYGGFMAGTGAAWRVAQMRPGEDPIAHLAAALRDAEIFAGEGEDGGLSAADFTETTLRRGPLGLSEAVAQGRLDGDENLLVLVDQFEELFRFEHLGAKRHADDSAAFVKLLLEATRGPLPIYVVLTMRSDYLGDCSRFRDLPAAIDAGQFLIPRLSRDQLRQAIVGPAAVGGAEVTSRLVQRLLAEVGDDPDQLPVLQHVLMRAWDLRAREIESTGASGPLDLPHYLETGGLGEALSRHADQAYEELDVRGRWIAEQLFRRITEMHDQRGVRRPTRLGEICAVAQATPEEVRRVIEVFRRPGRSFLMPPAGEPLEVETPIDISHESLMRVWTRLGEWTEQENASAMRYRRLSESARLHEGGESALMRDPELASTLEWRRRERPNAIWAGRYDDGFECAEAFLASSRKSQRRRRFWRRLAIALLLLTPFMGLGWSSREKIQAQQKKIQELEKQKAALVNRQQTLETENVERSSTLTQLRQQRQQLLQEVDELQLGNAALLVRLAELKQEISRLEAQASQLRQENSAIESSVASEQELVRELQQELVDLPEKIRQLQREVEELERWNLLGAEAEALGVEIYEPNALAADGIDVFDDLSPAPPDPDDSERLVREIRELQERLRSLQQERSALIQETAELERQIERLEEQRDALRQEHQRLQEEVAKLEQAERKRQRAVDQLLEQQQSLRQTLEALRIERTTLEDQLHPIETEHRALSRQRSRLRSENRALSRQRSENRLLEDYSATEKALQSALRSLTEPDPEIAARLALTAYRELEDKRIEREEITLALFSSLQKLDPSSTERMIGKLRRGDLILEISTEFDDSTEDRIRERIREPVLRPADLASAICDRLPDLTSEEESRLCGSGG